MPRELGLDRRLRPVRQRRGQRLPGGGGAVGAALLGAAGQHLEGVGVEAAQQHRLPVVPDAGADAADVADGQHGQQLQPARALDRGGEVAGGARVGQVALLGGVRHQQVVLHQPDHELGVLGVEPEARRQPLGDLGADRRMVASRALADVVQQEREVEHLAVDAALEDVGGDRQVVDELAALDLGERRDRADDVLVHRVVVVHVELHHRDDAAELGDEGAEHADLVHQPERPLGVVVAEQQLEEDAVGLRVGAHPVVDQPQARGHPPQRVGVDRDVGGEALLEQPQDVDRVLAEGVGVDEVEPAVVQPVALAGRVLAAREDRAQLGAEAGLRLDVARLEGGEEDAGQVADVLGVGEIVLHEPLDRPQRPGASGSRACRRSRPGCRRSAARWRGRSAGAGARGWSRGSPRPR